MDSVEAMKAELAMMREEKTCIEARLLSVESALAENKRVLSEFKAMKELVDDLLDVVIEAGGDNVDQNNSQNLDEETMKGLIEEAMKDFTEALNDAQSGRGCPADSRNGGGYDGRGSPADGRNGEGDDGSTAVVNIVKETHSGYEGGSGGEKAE